MHDHQPTRLSLPRIIKEPRMSRRVLHTVALTGALAFCLASAAHAGIALNTIDDHATYARNGVQVRTSGPIGCTQGERIVIRIGVRQAATGARASGVWRARCTGEVQHWQVRARAGTDARFAAGTVTVCAVAKTRAGQQVTETRKWCKRVPLSDRL
jgi:hypothetical protein